MSKQIVWIVGIIIVGICFCLTQMTSCEKHRHGTYAPIFLEPDYKLEEQGLKKVPVKEEE